MPTLPLPDGVALAYDDTGGVGVPVVLVHGILDGPDAWGKVAARLAAAGRRVLVVHSRGHGSTAARPSDWSPLAEAGDLATLLSALAPEGAHVVGHSRGGTSVGWLALDEPARVKSLAVIASPPQASEVFRAHFRRRLAHAKDEREASALAYLASIPDDDFPQHALRQYRGRALVVEAEDDPLYSPTHTMFWRMFLPYADFERVPGGHRFFMESDEAAEWLAKRLVGHFAVAEATTA